jgi:hypothetical protein
MHRKRKRDEPRANRIQASALAQEIRGYCDLGMSREPLRLAQAVSRKALIAPEEFFEAFRAVGVYAGFKTWRERIQKAHDGQSQRFKSECRPEMMEM